MQKILLFVLVSVFCLSANAQVSNGIITYNRKVDFIKIMSALPYMTSEEIDRRKLTWGNWSSQGADYNLYYKNNKSLYTQKPKEENTGGYSWKQEKIFLIRDHKKKEMNDMIESLGSKYLVQDNIPKRKWKILNEIKEIEGYLCMKAETTDTIKNQTIHAWFTDAIGIYSGPEGYDGLPGLILELNINDGSALVTATNIELELEDVKLPIPKKLKGKEVNLDKYNQLVSKFLADKIEGKENPYWRVRY